MPRRRWLAWILFALLVVALAPFLVLCLVFGAKLFLGAIILACVGLALLTGALLLWALAAVAAGMARRGRRSPP